MSDTVQIINSVEPIDLIVTTVGGNGSAITGKRFSGLMYEAYVNYSASAPAGTVVKLEEMVDEDTARETIFQLSAGNTDKTVHYRATAQTAAGADATVTNTVVFLVANAFLKVTVTDGGDVTDCVTVTIKLVQ